VSGVTGAGTRDLTEAVMRFLEERAAAEAADAAAGKGPAGDPDAGS
jgi:hypothetical protein